jgi:hypothetical protein
MNAKLAHLLTLLYPRLWRERYGAEFEAFLQNHQGGLRGSANVVCSALHERIFPTREGPMDQNSRSFQCWCIRAPWAIFGLAPLFLLAMAYVLPVCICGLVGRYFCRGPILLSSREVGQSMGYEISISKPGSFTISARRCSSVGQPHLRLSDKESSQLGSSSASF